MAGRYTMKIVTDFAAAHLLRDYPGACHRLHGHNWKVEVEITTRALDSIGMGIDFKVIKKTTKDHLDKWDHRHLNEIPPFDEINPTAENISAIIYQDLGKELNSDNVKVSAVTLWETERACVTYRED